MFFVKSTFGTSPGTFQAFQTVSRPLALVITSGFGAFSSSTEPLHFSVTSSFFFWARAWDGTAMAMAKHANNTQTNRRNIETPKFNEAAAGAHALGEAALTSAPAPLSYFLKLSTNSFASLLEAVS